MTGDSYDDIEPLLKQLAVAVETGAPDRNALREEAIDRCLPLADHIARKFSGRGEAFEDLLQVARLGLVQSIDRFDVSRGSRFLSFAVPTIMGEVRRYFRDSTWAVRVPRRVKETQVRLGVAIEALAQRLGRMPKARELAAELEVDEGELTQALLAANAYQSSSLEAACPDDGENAPLAMLDALGAEETGYQPRGSPPHCLEKFMRGVAVQPDSSRPDLGSLVRAGRRATFGRPFGDFSTSQTGRDRVSGCVVTGPNSLWAQ